MVAYFNDGIDNNFGENMNLFSSSGTDGQYKIQGTKNYGFITNGRAFNNSMTSMNGHASSWQVLPMPATVLRLKSSSTRHSPPICSSTQLKMPVVGLAELVR